MIVHRVDEEEHFRELEKVLEIHREAGIKLRPEKTKLFQHQVDYLGYSISKDGIGMKDDFIIRILEWPSPTTIKELNTFLGFVGYYHNFIPEFTRLTNEMYSQKKQKVLEWDSKF